MKTISLFLTLLSSLAAQPTVNWPLPVTPPNQPQTEADAESGRKYGRKLPVPEALQPGLDQSLVPYTPHGGKLTGHFRAASSDVLPGLVRAWVEKFHKYHPDVDITLEPPFAGSLGAKELVKGNLDLVFVSRELKPDDIADFETKFHYPPLSVPISGGSYRHFGFLDAVGFFVHKDNPVDRLSFEQLDALLSSTRHRGAAPVVKWGDVGLSGEWAERPIHVYGIQPWNGFEEFIRQRVLSVPGKRGEWREGLHYDKLVFPVAKRVSEDRYGIGYSGLAYIDAPVKLLSLAMDHDNAAYAPTYENVARAVYPLSRLVFLNTNKAPGQPLPAGLEEFLRFVLSREGQQTILDQGIYVPLRATQAEASKRLLR